MKACPLFGNAVRAENHAILKYQSSQNSYEAAEAALVLAGTTSTTYEATCEKLDATRTMWMERFAMFSAGQLGYEYYRDKVVEAEFAEDTFVQLHSGFVNFVAPAPTEPSFEENYEAGELRIAAEAKAARDAATAAWVKEQAAIRLAAYRVKIVAYKAEKRRMEKIHRVLAWNWRSAPRRRRSDSGYCKSGWAALRATIGDVLGFGNVGRNGGKGKTAVKLTGMLFGYNGGSITGTCKRHLRTGSTTRGQRYRRLYGANARRRRRCSFCRR